MTRRDFLNFEAYALGSFICRDPECSITGLRREYKCECGFTCAGPGDIWDHAQTCGQETRRQYVQMELPL